MYAYMYDIDMCDRSVICNILVVLVVLAGLVVLFMIAFCLVGLIGLVIARDLAGLAGGASLVEESLEGRVIELGLGHGRMLALSIIGSRGRL